jgi:hypothetical protein
LPPWVRAGRFPWRCGDKLYCLKLAALEDLACEFFTDEWVWFAGQFVSVKTNAPGAEKTPRFTLGRDQGRGEHDVHNVHHRVAFGEPELG